MSIYDYDNDFAHYECNESERKKLGQVWTPYSIIEKMMDKAGLITDKNSIWYDESKTNLDPTMGTGNIIIAILYRRIVECKQDPIVALKHVYGVELDEKTLIYAKNRIRQFMHHFTNKNISNILNKNFVCSDIFKWDINKWKPEKSLEEERMEIWKEFIS